MEKIKTKILNMPKKNVVHIEYCTNCQSHNWNTHHNEAKYHQTYIKLKNLIQEVFKQNSPTIYANKVPTYLIPIKQQQNKYYNSVSKKYVFFPNVGSFQVLFNDEPIFSKKKTNNWPCFETILNDLSLKINQKPLDHKIAQLKKFQTNQTQHQTDFSSDLKILPQAHRTLYKEESQSQSTHKKYGKFTLTDHFKTFHQQNNKKVNQSNSYHFDSSSTIKQAHEKNITKSKDQNQIEINVENMEGLKYELMKTKQGFSNKNDEKFQNQNKSNQKQILINLCSIEQESSNIKQIPKIKFSPPKKPSAFLNYQLQPLNALNGYNSSEKSLSLKRFQQINNDLVNIEKKFQCIQKKINKRDPNQQNGNNMSYEQKQPEENFHSLYQSKFIPQNKQNYYSHHIDNIRNQQLKSPDQFGNMENSRFKATDRYDERYFVPTYYEEHQLGKNSKSKKYSQIEKYLKANNQEKNKKLKKIYGDWKVGYNLNYLYYVDNAKKTVFRQSVNTQSKSRHQKQIKLRNSSNSSSLTSSISSDEQKDRISNRNLQTRQVKRKDQQISEQSRQNQKKKNQSFIIKHKSAYNCVSSSNKQNLINLRKDNQKDHSLQNLKMTQHLHNVSQNKVQRKQNSQISEKTKNSRSLYQKTSSKSLNNRVDVTKFNRKPQKSSIQHTKNLLKQVYTKEKHENKYQKRRFQQQHQYVKQQTSEQQSRQVSQIEQRVEGNHETSHQDKLRQNRSPNNNLYELHQADTVGNEEVSIIQKPIQKASHNEIQKVAQVQKKQVTQQKQIDGEAIEKPHQQNVSNQIGQRELSEKNSKDQNDSNLEHHEKIKLSLSQDLNDPKKQLKEQDSVNQKIISSAKENSQNEERQSQKKSENLQGNKILPIQQDEKIAQDNLIKTNQQKVQNTPFLHQNNENLHLNLNQQQNTKQTSHESPNNQPQNADNSSFSSKQKNRHSSSYQNSPRLDNHHSRSSSLYQQPTYSHTISLNNHVEVEPCKCSQRDKQLQINRQKIQSQRKQKQMMKEKRIEENRKRKEFLEKEKQVYLKSLKKQQEGKRSVDKVVQIKNKSKSSKSSIQINNSPNKEEVNNRERIYFKKTLLQNQNQSNSHAELISQSPAKSDLKKAQPIEKQVKRNNDPSKQQNEVKITKSMSKKEQPVKNEQSQKKKILSNTLRTHKNQQKKIETNTKNSDTTNFKNQNKPIKSKTQAQKNISKQNITVKNTQNLLKEKSATAIASKKDKIEPQNNKKIQSKLSKTQSVTEKNNELSKQKVYRQQHLSRTAKSHKNKSYFRIQKEEKSKSPQKKSAQKIPLVSEQQQTENSCDQVSENRSIKNSVGIQTMEFNDVKLQTDQTFIPKTKRNQSIQSKRSSVASKRRSVRSVSQSADSIRKNQIIQQIYAPTTIQRKNNKKNRNSLRNSIAQIDKLQIEANEDNVPLITQESRESNAQPLKQNNKQVEQSFINIFEAEQNKTYRQETRMIEIPIDFYRQDALILKQLYNMQGHMKSQKSKYEQLYTEKKMYSVVNQNGFFEYRDEHLSIQDISSLKIHKKNANIFFAPLEEVLKSNSGKELKQLMLFGKQSIQIDKLKSNSIYSTRKLHKVLHILAQKNQLMIARLFQDYKSSTNIVISREGQQAFITKLFYGVWLCINKTWKMFIVDHKIPVFQQQNRSYSPICSFHQGNQIWPLILEKAIAKAVGGYSQLFSLSIGQIFSILTGSNHFTYSINENISKNKYFLKQISENDKKNFIMVCEKHSMNLKEENEKMIEDPKIFYLLSKKIVNNGQSEEILFKMQEVTLRNSTEQSSYSQPYYMRYDKFCQKFKSCEALHLRQHNNFSSIALNQSISTPKSKQLETKSFFNVVELIFDEQCFGTITVCNQQKSDLKTYLYKLQHSDNQIMKLVGQATRINKTELFFDCYFQTNKYYVFIQSSNPHCVVSYMGEGKPQIKLKQQIFSKGLNNQSIEYLPVSNYQGFDCLKGSMLKTGMGKTFDTGLYSSKISQNKEPMNIEDLRQMFIEVLLEEKKSKLIEAK